MTKMLIILINNFINEIPFFLIKLIYYPFHYIIGLIPLISFPNKYLKDIFDFF